ncbi:MAG TPA: hypothetical protein VLO29_01940 [Salegentibacter sp.]|nr:hypothetical protein [Salegentibacter sp.]
MGLFSLMLLHQIIPHLHHEHSSKHDHSELEHAHSHDHQQEDEPDETNSLFSFLLAMHSHIGGNSEVPVVKTSTEQITPKKEKTENPVLQNFFREIAFSEDEGADFIGNYQPPPKYSKLYLSHRSLRGPPHKV